MPDPDFHDGKRHIVGKENDQWTRATGSEQEALCGYRFVPSNDPSRAPGRFPLCAACEARAKREGIGWEEGPDR